MGPPRVRCVTTAPDRPQPPSGRTIAAVVVTLLAWASAFVAIRGGGGGLLAGALALGRLLVGTVVLGLLLARPRLGPPDAAGSGRCWSVCGVGWFGIYNVALNAAEQHLDAGTTAMLVNIGPILIAVFAGLLLGEGFPRWLLAGIAVAFAGVAADRGGDPAGARPTCVGVVLCVVAAVTYAGGVVAQKPLLRRLPGLQVTVHRVRDGRGLLPAVGRHAGRRARRRAGRLDRRHGLPRRGADRARLQHLGLRAGRMDAGKLGVTTYVVPPLVILLGWLLLDEVPPALALVGGAVCLAGVGLSRRRSPVRPPVPVPAGGQPHACEGDGVRSVAASLDRRPVVVELCSSAVPSAPRPSGAESRRRPPRARRRAPGPAPPAPAAPPRARPAGRTTRGRRAATASRPRGPARRG